MATTPYLDLSLLVEGAQGNETHVNRMMVAMDSGVLMGIVLAISNNGTANDYNAYIVGAAPTGEFAGAVTNDFAYYQGQWYYISPREGWRLWNQGDSTEYNYDGADWVPYPNLPSISRANREVNGNGVKTIATPGVAKESDTEIRVYAGTRFVTDYELETTTEVSWLEQVVTDTLIATAFITYVTIDTNGDVILLSYEPRDGSGDEYCQIGVAIHLDSSIVDFVDLAPATSINLAGSVRDVWDTMKLRNLDDGGNVFSAASSTLNTLDKTAGEIGGNRGRNAANDLYSANITTLPDESPQTFALTGYHNGSGGSSLVPNSGVVPTTLIDDGTGTPAAMTEGYWATIRVYVEPSSGLTCYVLPQAEWKGWVEAIQSINDEKYDPIPATGSWLRRAFITFRKGAAGFLNNPDVRIANADRDGQAPINPITAQRSLGTPFYSPLNFASSGVGSGVYFIGQSNLEFSTTDANLNEGSTTQAFGTANQPHASHPFIVAAGPGTVTGGGQVGLRVNYTTSITDAGVRTNPDSTPEVLTDDITTLSTDQILEAVKKHLGIITFELYVVSGTPSAYALDFNYGTVKYDDFGNRDFMLTGIEMSFRALANDTGFDAEVFHWPNCGCTYAATGFDPLDTALASFVGDNAADSDLTSGGYHNWKRTSGIDESIHGDNGGGVITKITQGAANSVHQLQGRLEAVL